MAGTKEGGRQAARTNKKRYGDGVTPNEHGVVKPNFYSLIGAKGGKISRGGGFAASKELAQEAGRKGGKASRRPKNPVSS